MLSLPVVEQADVGLLWALGGAIYATYNAIIQGQIKNAVLELKLAVQDRIGKVEQELAVAIARNLTLEGSVKVLADQVALLAEHLRQHEMKAAERANKG